ncbi:MAG: Plasmid stabilization system [Candidatus Giovannonibacteria bacterium GW2011_GWA1_43_15]|uniref:Plasmid stabilization system n=1 Tax=Candidatus Giovannonibacteria bacterium GW2011_GWA2_44_26 TaxID=1618648 RepID=A0A0G1IW63_9BACT|nr:MAG: Plasmid stabilization system [Candidatus Giovannonibacteria bacterium GW2011_GWB1_43_13]KKS99915.1 MAG: Plasmid stabilization system [Candidatus Giovannonibacteria bacterium GW2011_GWA1_43_15]KKT21529.1 MAG: Plasmid stabilization system [Candidatus Giovannonibacteria bacterium GW2011_GWC2_43_8]KKT63616.1 MAG: Plasmid stabilization system [Candidatus Giovannonibacteria bacterium GW2011_GWA2_44_26]
MKRKINVEYSSGFKRAYGKLDNIIKKKTERRISIFLQDLFDKRLDTHKLHGKLQNFWAFSIDDKYRVVFGFVNDMQAVLLDIDDHDLYR